MGMFNGTAQNDTLTGTDGADSIYGAAGDDTLSGLGGDDVLEGDAGADTYTGGPGADTFSLLSGPLEWADSTFGAMDVVKDFTFADGDRLQINDTNGLLVGIGGPLTLAWRGTLAARAEIESGIVLPSAGDQEGGDSYDTFWIEDSHGGAGWVAVDLNRDGVLDSDDFVARIEYGTGATVTAASFKEGTFGSIAPVPTPVLDGMEPGAQVGPITVSAPGVATASLSSADLLLHRTSDGTLSIYSDALDQTVQLAPGFSALKLVDGTVVLGAEADGAYVARLYSGFLGREADADGLAYWAEQMSAGLSRTDVAHAFLNTAEGAPLADSATAIQTLYQDLLGRAVDDDGLSFWQEVAETQGLASALEGIAGSTEAEVAMDLGAGLWIYDQNALTVKSLYQFAFDRQADTAGLAFWTQALDGGVDAREIAATLAASEEFQNRAGNGTDEDFVDALYQAMGRGADEDGQAYWVQQLEGGADRAELLLSFATSEEAFAQTAEFRAGDNLWAPP